MLAATADEITRTRALVHTYATTHGWPLADRTLVLDVLFDTPVYAWLPTALPPRPAPNPELTAVTQRLREFREDNPPVPQASHALCGTPSGEVRHRRLKELVCGPCLRARREYQADYRRRRAAGEDTSRKRFTVSKPPRPTAADARRQRIAELERSRILERYGLMAEAQS